MGRILIIDVSSWITGMGGGREKEGRMGGRVGGGKGGGGDLYNSISFLSPMWPCRLCVLSMHFLPLKKKTNTAACNETVVLVGAKLNLAILSELNVCFVVR